jgi:hypothetical protein
LSWARRSERKAAAEEPEDEEEAPSPAGRWKLLDEDDMIDVDDATHYALKTFLFIPQPRPTDD